MKKLLTASVLFFAGTCAQAEEAKIKYVSGDDTALSQICVQAVTSDMPVSDVAKNMGVSKTDVFSLACNGQQIHDFVRSERNAMEDMTSPYISVTFVTGDRSQLSQLCVRAINSQMPLRELAAEADMELRDIDRVACNDQPIADFVRQYRKQEADITAVDYKFNTGDSSLETELCVAAVTSRARYEAMLEQHFSGQSNVEEKILCNRRPLDSFMKKYASGDMTAAL